MRIFRTTLWLAASVVVGWLSMGGAASASMDMQKKAKAAGFEANNCQYCHVDKMPKKESHAANDRGKFLVAEKERLKAKEIDVSWLKNYVEKK